MSNQYLEEGRWETPDKPYVTEIATAHPKPLKLRGG